MNTIIDHFAHIVIIGFILITILLPKTRKDLLSRGVSEWILDGMSLLNHFVIIPIFQVTILYKIYSILLAPYENSNQINLITSLGLNMLIDYAWYWNHRLLHSRTMLWNFHMVHHAAEHLDVLASARNSFWSPILMIYMWSFSLILFLVKNPLYYITILAIYEKKCNFLCK